MLKAQGAGMRQIARAIRRDPSTISRELRRNAATRVGSSGYRASVAQWKAELAAKRPKPAKLATNPKLRAYVEERLSGQITRPDGSGHRTTTTSLHRQLQTAPQAPSVGARLEPRADRPADQVGLPP